MWYKSLQYCNLYKTSLIKINNLIILQSSVKEKHISKFSKKKQIRENVYSIFKPKIINSDNLNT